MERRVARRGEAPLEFVMVLPLIVFFLGGIVWMGFFMDAHSHVVGRARHEAWKHRDEPGSGAPYRFRVEDPVEESVNERVRFSIFNSLPPTRSRHVVLVGAWDHRRTPLDSQPNWQHYATFTTEAGRGAVQQVLQQLNVLAGGLPSISEMIAQEVNPAMAILGQIQQQGFEQKARRNAEAERQKQLAQASELKGESDGLGTMIKTEQEAEKKAEARVKELDEQLKDSTLSDDEREAFKIRRDDAKKEAERARDEAKRLKEVRQAKDAERKVWEAAAKVGAGNGGAADAP